MEDDPPHTHTYWSELKVKPLMAIFASHVNIHCPSYITKEIDPQALAHDMLKTPLREFPLTYTRPPWNMVSPFLLHLQ